MATETANAAGRALALPPAPPSLRLEVMEELGTGGFDERDFDTPREAPTHASLFAEGLPTSPTQRKTKSRAAHALSRNASFASRNSLKDSKVLMVTEMKRSDSLLQPDLFSYHNHFEFLEVVGRTHLSEVFRVRHGQNGDLYAVKRSRRRFKSKAHRQRCLREISAVAALPAHPNIVGQYRAWQEGGHFYIQMDFCEGGSLHQLLVAARCQGCLLSDEELWSVLWEVASGLEFLHGRGVLHLDIKPENIYRDASGVCQIGDFGLAVSIETKEWWEEGDGDYVAPELLRSHGEPSPAADIYSLGATLYECATGAKLAQALQSGATPAEATLHGRPAALQTLMHWMLHPDPTQRPSASQVLQFIRDQGVAPLDACIAPAAGATAAIPTPFASPSVLTAVAEPGAIPPSPFAAMEEGGDSQWTQQGGASGFGFPLVELSQDSLEGGVEEERACDATAATVAATTLQHLPFSFAPLPPPPMRKQHLSFGGFGGGGEATPATKPPRKCGRGGGGSARARRAAAAVGGLQRWVPSLSPLVSEGALTPGALAMLSPFSSVKARGRPSPLEVGSTPGSPRASPSPVVSQPGSQPARNSTESREGWHLSRRDMISPDSDVLARSITESDLYSFSCGTGGSCSSLDFMDTGASHPTSPEFQSAAGPQTATPELFQRAQPPAVAAAEAVEEEDGARALPHKVSLDWDLHTSPEFLMQLPPGSPGSPSTTTEDSQPSRSFSSVRRFPTLDSMENMQLEGSAGSMGGKAGDSAAHMARFLSFSSFASLPHRLSLGAGQQQQPMLAEAAAAAGSGLVDPMLQVRKRPLSRHNSRRGLLTVLSREGSLASCTSLDQAQQQLVQRVKWGTGEADLEPPRPQVAAVGQEVGPSGTAGVA